jgi:L-lysine 2,3-aminomutase
MTDFNVRRLSKDGRQPRCRDCAKAWYQANATQHKANTRRRTDRVRKQYQVLLGAYLAEHSCVDCGESDIRCLEFDHEDPAEKHAEVTRLLMNAGAWRTVLAEIEKCSVRCSNCHRRRTMEQISSWRHAVWERDAFHGSARLARLFPSRL